MREKRKKTKEIKLRDMKPVKDAKGGYPPPCGPGRSIRGGMSNHNETFGTPDGHNHNEAFL